MSTSVPDVHRVFVKLMVNVPSATPALCAPIGVTSDANYDPSGSGFDSSGQGTAFASSGLDNPYGLAFDSSGNLYAANFGNNTIEKFDFFGNETVFAAAGLNGPVGVAFDSLGNLYVSNYFDNTIEKFDSTGNGSFFAASPDHPYGLAFDPSGNLYVALAQSNTIEKFDSVGNSSVFASSGLNFPTFIAVSPPAFAPAPTTVSVATPTGANVSVSAGNTGSIGVDLTFANVTVAGDTTVTPINPTSAGTLPSGYELLGNNIAFQITTTATYTPPVTVCFHIPLMDPATFASLRVLHNSGSGLVDETYSLDTATQTICARVNSLIPFVIAKLACTPPVIQSVTASPNSIWPPNKKFTRVTVTVKATATCGIASTKIISVTSNESGSGQYQITGDLTVNLLADRNGNGTGRTYTITVQCKDTFGNASTKTVTVTVPHDQGK
jgi:hypothetical protein